MENEKLLMNQKYFKSTVCIEDISRLFYVVVLHFMGLTSSLFCFSRVQFAECFILMLIVLFIVLFRFPRFCLLTVLIDILFIILYSRNCSTK